MGRKKPFIKKGEGVKFYLVHRSQKDPLYLADDLGDHVLVPADPDDAEAEAVLPKSSGGLISAHLAERLNKREDASVRDKRLQEQQKYGIYYEDDYDYLQHLREVNVNDEEEEEDEVLKVGSVLIKTDAYGDNKKQQASSNNSKLVLPSTVFASKYEEDVGYFNQAAPDHDPKIHWDPDIVRLLDEDAEIPAAGEEGGDLEDDFFIRANQDPPAKNKTKKDDNADEEDEEDDDEDNYSNRADDDDDDDDYEDYDDDDEEEGSETRSMRDMERKSRFSEYSMTSSVIRRNEGLKLLDEQFERFYAQYDEDQIGTLDTEDIDGFRGQDSVLRAALEEFSKMVEKKGLVTDRVPKTKKLPVLKERNEEEEETGEKDGEEEEDEEEDEEEEDKNDEDSETEVLRFDRKRDRDDRLDCESIISTYSNIYNHPATIKSGDEDESSSHGAKIRLSKKSGLPLGVLSEKDKSKRELERIEHNIVRVLPELPLKRDPNESREEKKERKQAIKAHRRERRMEKKINKMAFKDEKKSQEAQIRNTVNNKNIVKLPL